MKNAAIRKMEKYHVLDHVEENQTSYVYWCLIYYLHTQNPSFMTLFLNLVLQSYKTLRTRWINLLHCVIKPVDIRKNEKPLCSLSSCCWCLYNYRASSQECSSPGKSNLHLWLYGTQPMRSVFTLLLWWRLLELQTTINIRHTWFVYKRWTDS